MNIKQIAKIHGGQDGAIFGDFLFRFNHQGECFVYDLKTADENSGNELPQFSSFVLDGVEKLKPHSNSVAFGSEYAEEGDEFPLLYANIYNNHAGMKNPLKGVTLVYRVVRQGTAFTTSLLQMIEIGFVEDVDSWRSYPQIGDVRPYGNFAIDTQNGIYYAFTMRDKSQSTRYFSFKMPKLSDGDFDEEYGIRRVVLDKGDLLGSFDCPYQHYIQGACFYGGHVFSAEGFTDNADNLPAMRVINPESRQEVLFVDLVAMGFAIEPEMVDFHGNICYYSDFDGNLFAVDFGTDLKL